ATSATRSRRRTTSSRTTGTARAATSTFTGRTSIRASWSSDVRSLVLAAAIAATVLPSRSRADPNMPYAVDTLISGGYRTVDVDGSKDKYKEDYNLRSGLRLFDFDVDGVAKAPDTTRLDRFHLQVETPGDEPVSHLRLTAR